MRALRITAMVALLAAGTSAPAQAQAADDRFRISVDAGVQFSSIAFDTAATRVIYIENAALNTAYTVRRGLLGDGGVSIRLAGGLAIGVTVSSVMATHDANISAAIPHPFFFKTPRTVAGTATDLHHDELAVHVQALYILHPSPNVELGLSAGPSFFQLRQDVMTDIAFSDVYPYDAPAFMSASTQRVSANAIGFNAGADVGFRLSRHAGLGASVRLSRAVIDLAVPNGGTVSVDAGGAQVVGGLRLFF